MTEPMSADALNVIWNLGIIAIVFALLGFSVWLIKKETDHDR